jgi:molybdopterin synthase catalytic subunit
MSTKSFIRSATTVQEQQPFLLAQPATRLKVYSWLAQEIFRFSTFISGKTVTRLEYQAYSRLAIKTMANIIRTAQESALRSNHHPASQSISSLIRCAIHHRLGVVRVGEPSIVIAVSSPHRREAFVACELILEEIKLKAQIWKREYYGGDSEKEPEWKANTISDPLA